MTGITNRIKFFAAGDILELANPWLPGHPHDRTAALAGQLPFGRALELCGGTGYGARRIAAAHPAADLHSIDISPEMIASGRRWLSRSQLTNVTLVQGDVGSLPYPDDSFDLVFSTFGIHEVPTAVRLRAVCEAARVCVPGGRFVITDLDLPSAPPASWLTSAYMRAMEPRDARGVFGDGLSTLLADNGFAVTCHQPSSWWSPIQTLAAVRH